MTALRYLMLTTEANSLVSPIHHRMPSILSGDEQARYMAGGMDVFAPLPKTLVANDASNPLLKDPATDSQDELFRVSYYAQALPPLIGSRREVLFPDLQATVSKKCL